VAARLQHYMVHNEQRIAFTSSITACMNQPSCQTATFDQKLADIDTSIFSPVRMPLWAFLLFLYASCLLFVLCEMALARKPQPGLLRWSCCIDPRGRGRGRRGARPCSLVKLSHSLFTILAVCHLNTYLICLTQRRRRGRRPVFEIMNVMIEVPN
jgi:hypothetical protein